MRGDNCIDAYNEYRIRGCDGCPEEVRDKIEWCHIRLKGM